MDISFSTSAVSSPDRLDAWRDVLCKAFGPIEASKISEQDFDGSVRTYKRADLRFTDICYRGQTLERTPRNLAATDEEYFTFSQPLSGPLHATQRNRSFTIKPGTLILANQFVPYKVTANEAYRAFSIWIPRRLLLQRQPCLDSYYSIRIDDGSPRGQLLTSFAQTLSDGMSEWSDQEAISLRDQMLDLIVLMMVNENSGTISNAESSVKAAHRERAAGFIRQMHRDLGLNAKTVAAACGISVSYLHQVFRDANLQVADLIRAQRLETASKLLLDPGSHAKNVQQIAFDSGFGELSQFVHAFQDKFGMTPNDFRYSQRVSMDGIG